MMILRKWLDPIGDSPVDSYVRVDLDDDDWRVPLEPWPAEEDRP